MKPLFVKNIKTHKLCSPANKILLAVSGGIDSNVMLHLFLKAGYKNISVAHCNFRLRGKESDADEAFVAKSAVKHDLNYHTISFDTEKYAAKNGISIQMAARDLRYSWFEELKNTCGYNYVAIAHNSDDVIETFLINLSRGTGMKGLTGMKPKNKYIIRPLLFASRKDISEYAKKHKIKFREDSSNKETKYTRNLIRHEIIPLFTKINPSFKKHIHETMGIIDTFYNAFIEKVKLLKQEITETRAGKELININELISHSNYNDILYELIHDKGFSGDIIKQITASVKAQSGKTFFSGTHKIVKDRDHLILSPIEKKAIRTAIITKSTRQIKNPLHLSLKKISVTPEFRITPETNVAYLDYSKIKFPLTLQLWKKGDTFCPLGMKKRKKLSDFLIDNKVSITDKENCYVIVSGNDIVWVVNMRIDERYKITQNTKTVLKIEIV